MNSFEFSKKNLTFYIVMVLIPNIGPYYCYYYLCWGRPVHWTAQLILISAVSEQSNRISVLFSNIYTKILWILFRCCFGIRVSIVAIWLQIGLKWNEVAHSFSMLWRSLSLFVSLTNTFWYLGFSHFQIVGIHIFSSRRHVDI